MALRLVSASAPPPSNDTPNETPPPDDYPFAETPLVVVFAATDDLTNVANNSRVPLAAMPDISPDDAYLVLPLRAREGLVTAFARGVGGRVARWFEEAVVVRAEIDGGRAPRLWVGAAWKALDVLARSSARTVAMDGVGDPMRVINQLPFIEGIAPGGLLDRAGTQAITTRASYIGVARMGIEELGLGADAVEPTFVWSEREGLKTRVKVALAASEDDTVIALLSPLTLIAAG